MEEVRTELAICNECGGHLKIVKDVDWETNNIEHTFPENETIIKVIERYKIPFTCSICGSLKFPYKALNGIAFVWPKPIEECQGKVYIPENIRDNFKTSFGVVLSVGKGCINKKTHEFVESQVVPGSVVLYDKSIPWKMMIKASDGKEYSVDLMNILDINATVEE